MPAQCVHMGCAKSPHTQDSNRGPQWPPRDSIFRASEGRLLGPFVYACLCIASYLVMHKWIRETPFTFRLFLDCGKEGRLHKSGGQWVCSP